MRRSLLIAALTACLLTVAGCGGGATRLIIRTTSTAASAASPAAGLGFPVLATKNTTRVSGVDSIANAAGVALAVFPSAAPGTHPTAVALAPTDDWQAAIAASVLMAPPIRAPLLLSGPGALPAATSNALGLLAPTGSGPAAGAQVIRIGDVPAVKGYRGGVDLRERAVRAGRVDRPVRQRRRRQAEHGRRDRARATTRHTRCRRPGGLRRAAIRFCS